MGIDGLQENIKTFFVNDLSPILCRLNNYILNSGDPQNHGRKLSSLSYIRREKTLYSVLVITP